MARKSKRFAVDIKPPEQEKIYNVAVYIRLSIEDRLYKNGSDSLSNQRELIYDYLEGKSDMKIYGVYCDNGETGTNFEREDFQRMMYDVYNGKVNCIVVKDLSRFGREYIEAGDYLDRIFPLIGVRFIAINDHYDNKVNPFDITVPIKNIINTLYARDLSRKSAAALRMKQANGEFIGTYAAYGYLKSPENKHKIIIDEETAPVVRQIFEWKAEGLSYAAICRKLYDMKIMPPMRYRYDKGIVKDKRGKDKVFWRVETLKNMLENEVYIGNMVQGRRKSHFYDGKKETRTDKSEWIIVPNTHEPIVSKELFDKVQKILEERHISYHRNLGKYNKISNGNNLFKRKIVCGDCNTNLIRYKNARQSSKKARYTYICPIHSQFPKQCEFLSIDEETLKNVVMRSINMQIGYLTNIEAMIEKASKSKAVRQKRIAITKEISDILSSISYIKASRVRTVTDYTRNLLDEDTYRTVMAEFEADLKIETKKLEIVNKQKDKLDRLLSSTKWIAGLKKFTGSKKLTQEIVDAFIKKIRVYPDKKIEIEWACTERCEAFLDLDKGGEHLAG